MAVRPRVKIICGPLPLAPFGDVVFLLLFFFMISSSLVFWPGLRIDTKVRLPESRANSTSAADKLIITMVRADLWFFNDRRVSPEELERELQEEVRNSRLAAAQRGVRPEAEAGLMYPSPVVVLRADKSIPYGKIVEVMSLARSLNLGVFLVTDSQAGSRTERLRGIGEAID